MMIPNNKFISFISKHRFVILIAVLFLILRLPAIHHPYHQDEWKNVATSETVEGAGAFFTHPPFFGMMFVLASNVFGEDYYRLLPLLFSIATGILLFLVVRNRFDKRAATWSLILFAICFYNILGSLSPDVEGAIIPFFFLLAVYIYDKLNLSKDRAKIYWLIGLVFTCLIGFLIKLNFVLVMGALAIDYILTRWKVLNIKKVAIGAGGIVGFVFLYLASIYLIQVIYPTFSISAMFGHADQYTGAGRNWLQIVVQGVKAIFYLSPLLILPVFFVSKDILKRSSVFIAYLIIGFVFYFAIFDFSRGALDKYLMFSIVPLVIIVGAVFSDTFNNIRKSSMSLKIPIIVGLLLSLILVLLNFLPHEVLPLYPKTLWFSRVIHSDWLFLNPFNGGSGPMGFYVSFLFIAVSFIVSSVLALIGFFKKQWRTGIAIVLVFVGLTYNGILAEEYLFGRINGSAPAVLLKAVDFIEHEDSIKSVITYNDTGNQYLSGMRKYSGRIYAVPESEQGYREKFANFDGHYLIVDIPPFNPESFYGKFFAECDTLFEAISGKITGRVYDCDNVATTDYE